MSTNEISLLVAYAILGSSILLSTGCTPKPDPECLALSDILALVTVEPAQATYRVGDTVRVAATFPRFTYDLAREEAVEILEVNLTHYTYLQKLDTISGPYQNIYGNVTALVDAPSAVGNLFINGTTVGAIQGTFEHRPDGSFQIAYDMVLKRSGDYLHRFATHSHEPWESIVTVGQCGQSRRVFYELQADNDGNFQYIMDSPWYTYDIAVRTKENGFDRLGGYVFRVVED